MDPVEITSLAAEVSLLYSKLNPCSIRVVRVINHRTLEVQPSNTPVSETSFWESAVNADLYIPDIATRRARYHEYHRSFGCDRAVLMFAATVKELVDQGVPLTHQGRPILNILVLNTENMDVSDLLNHCLRLRDHASGTEVSVLATSSEQKRAMLFPPSVRRSFGWGEIPSFDKEVEKQRRIHFQHYDDTVPHWWLAAVVDGKPVRQMLHIDLCGPAYDADAMVPLRDTWVPLQCFMTPELEIEKHVSLSHKFMLHPVVCNVKRSCFQAMHVRHLRCFTWPDSSSVSITALDKFLDRRSDDLDSRFYSLLETLRHSILLEVKQGTEVRVRGIQTRKELNGRCGWIQSGSIASRPGSNRIPVLVRGLEHPNLLKPGCIRLSISRKQYLTHAEMVRKFGTARTAGPATALQGRHSTSPKQEAVREDIFEFAKRDADVRKVVAAMTTGKMKFSSYGDQAFKRGVQKLLPTFQALDQSLFSQLSQQLELAEHPKSLQAINLIKLLQSTKQRALQQGPRSGVRDASAHGAINIAEGSELAEIFNKVANKIRADEGLMYVFDQLDILGLFNNPANQTLFGE